MEDNWDSAPWGNPNEEYNLIFRVILGFILLLINGTGLILNGLVLSVGHSHERTVSTVSNIFITNLNIVDIIICLTAIPFTLALVLTSRLQTPLFCFFHEATISFASSASAIGLLVITLHRYTSIVTPFKKRFTLKNVKVVVGGMWFVSLIGFGSPFLALTKSKWLQDSSELYNDNMSEIRHALAIVEDKVVCFQTFEPSSGSRVYYELYYVVLYLLANTVMLVCYTSISVTARSRVQIGLAFLTASVRLHGFPPHSRNAPKPSDAQKNLEKGLSHTTMRVVSTFMVCWGPHAITSTIGLFAGFSSSLTLEMVQLCCLALAYSSCVLHPLIYVLMQGKFRRAFTERITIWRVTRVVPIFTPHPQTLQPTVMVSETNKSDKSQTDNQASEIGMA